MFVMFRFELKLSVTISNWVTSYTLHGVGLCWRDSDSSRLPSVIQCRSRSRAEFSGTRLGINQPAPAVPGLSALSSLMRCDVCGVARVDTTHM